MKTYAVFLLCFACTLSLFGQTNPTAQKGNLFSTTAEEHFNKVINPWKYQYTQIKTGNLIDAVNKIGQIVFWRSTGIYDNVSKKYWKPDISFDIYPDSDSAFCKDLSEKIKLLSSCDSINKGGDIFLIGHFILLNVSSCINCASSSNIDYCRNIIKYILASVPDKDTADWNAILDQFVISKAKFKK